jgi:hypothetical protein
MSSLFSSGEAAPLKTAVSAPQGSVRRRWAPQKTPLSCNDSERRGGAVTCRSSADTRTRHNMGTHTAGLDATWMQPFPRHTEGTEDSLSRRRKVDYPPSRTHRLPVSDRIQKTMDCKDDGFKKGPAGIRAERFQQGQVLSQTSLIQSKSAGTVSDPDSFGLCRREFDRA